jgi:chaperone BCS1
MTTNHPEKLDEALIRPGRVDHQVAFTNATQKQVRELFERMYTSELPKMVTKLMLSPDSSFSHSTATTTSHAFTANSLSFKRHNPSILTPPPTPSLNVKAKGGIRVETDSNSEDLSYLAGEFAEKVPDGLFSPAEIQGFLLRRKTDPRKAVLEVEAWVEGMKEQKRMGTKLVSVQ